MTGKARPRTNYRAAALDRTAPTTAAAGVTAMRSKPVRITVDLASALHGEMKDWTRETAAALGRDVALADVVRVLARRVLDDPTLARQVRSDLADLEK